MPAPKLEEWLSSLKPERQTPEKIRVTRNRNDTDDLLVYKPVYGGRRAVEVRTMVRRKAHKRPVAPLLSNTMEEEGIQLLLEEAAPGGYDHQYPCAICQQFVFGSEGAWKGYLGEKLEMLLLNPGRLDKMTWKRLCRHCRIFVQKLYTPCKKARGELRVRHQLKDLTEDQKREEAATFKAKWAEQYKQLRKELKKGGAPDAALTKYRQEVTRLLQEVG